MQTHSIKKFVIRGILFALPLLLFLSWWEIKLSQIPNSYNKKNKLFKTVLSDCEVLVLGASHAYQGVKPACFSRRGFNMAANAQDLYYDTEILSRYCKQMPKLRMVIFTLSYYSLETAGGYGGGETWRPFFYKRFYNIPAEKWKKNWDLRNYSLIALYEPHNSMRYLKSRLTPDLAPNLSDSGWHCVLSDDNQRKHRISDALGENRAKYHSSSMSKANIAHNLALLHKGIRLCNKQDITPVIVTTPIYHTYSDHMDALRYQRMQTSIRQLCAEQNVKYANYLFDERFGISDFFDNDHLNAIGGKKFSKILNDEVVAPAFK